MVVRQPVFSNDIGLTVQLDVNHGLISVHATNQSLRNILREICKKANVQLILEGEFSTRVTISYDKLPLKQAIVHLVRNRGSILVMIHADDAGKLSRIFEKMLLYDCNEGSAIKTNKDISQEIQKQLEWVDYLALGPEDEAVLGLAEILSAEEQALVVKQHALDALTDFNSDQVADALANGLSNERNNMRASIVRALGQLEDEPSSLILAQVLFGDSDNEIRLLAVQQLAGYQTLAAKAFLQAATKDTDELVQIEAQYALDAFDIN